MSLIIHEPDAELARKLRNMIDYRGLHRVSGELGFSGEALARYLARIELREATARSIEERLRHAEESPALREREAR